MFDFGLSPKIESGSCLRCGTPLELAESENTIKLYKYGLLTKKTSNVLFYVCPNCGHVEMKADNPSIFAKKK